MSTCKAVLIVEDDPTIRDCLKELLVTEGFHVLTAEDGIEGLRTIATMPRPALVLLDLMMPRMDGWEVLKNLRMDDSLAPIPVVVTSAVADSRKIQGASDILKKPYSLDAVVGVVRKYCGGPA